MSEISQQITEDNALRSEYRSRLASILWKCSRYTGKSEDREAILQGMVDMEAWLDIIFEQKSGVHITEQSETEALKSWHPKNIKRKINDLLQLSLNAHEASISRMLKGESDDFLTVNLPQEILPSGVIPRVITAKGRSDYEKPRFQNRIKELLMALETKGIHTDDIILIKGNQKRRTMRQKSYTIIEIPKINRSVLINDQIKEATFVTYGIFSRDIFTGMSKEELETEFSGRVIRIIRMNKSQWLRDVFNHLFKNINPKSIETMDVCMQERLRQETFTLKPTPQDWADMKQMEKRNFKILGKGLRGVGGVFDVEGRPRGNTSDHRSLGRAIYGEGHECLMEPNAKNLRMIILRKWPTAEDWKAMRLEDRKTFKILGIGFKAAASEFGMSENPRKNLKNFYAFGRIIYGDHDCLKQH